MKNLIRYVAPARWPGLIGLAFNLVLAGHLAAADLSIALTPHLPEELRAGVRQEIRTLVLRTLPAESSLTLVDGWTGSMITRLEIPKLPVDSESGRLRKLRRELATWMQWEEKQAGVPALRGTGALQLPEIVRKLRRTQSGVLLLVGSPIYRSPASPDHDWTPEGDWLYPSDGTLFARPGGSPWGVSQTQNRLAGTPVHWLLLGELGAPGLYREKVKRFNWLYVHHEGGKLVAYLDDTSKVFGELFDEDRADLHYALDHEPKSVELVSLKVAAVRKRSEEIDPYFPSSGVKIPTLADERTRTLLEQFEKTATEHGAPVSVGVTWDRAGVDIDLHVYEGGDPVPLSFDHPANRHGRYLGDFRDATGGGLEQVVLNAGVTMQFEAWINLHSVQGSLPGPINGKVILRNQGKTEFWSFTFDVVTGNQGGNREGRATSPFWKKVAVARTDGGKTLAK